MAAEQTLKYPKYKPEYKQRALAAHRDGEPRGVVYIGHVPHGFFERQMKEYFSQFGHVKKLRISRSKKNGNSKGYAFIEFKHKSTAEIVSETMNNYLMFNKLLKCEVIPEERVHRDMFVGANRKFVKPKAAELAAQRHDAPKTKTQLRRAKLKELRKDQTLTSKMRRLGVKYNMPVKNKKGAVRYSITSNKKSDTKTVNKKRQTKDQSGLKIREEGSSPHRKRRKTSDNSN